MKSDKIFAIQNTCISEKMIYLLSARDNVSNNSSFNELVSCRVAADCCKVALVKSSCVVGNESAVLLVSGSVGHNIYGVRLAHRSNVVKNSCLILAIDIGKVAVYVGAVGLVHGKVVADLSANALIYSCSVAREVDYVALRRSPVAVNQSANVLVGSAVVSNCNVVGL